MAYSSVSISGYNSSAPPDDGSQTEANKICWAKIKEKLSDPLKTAIESINSQATTEFGAISSTYLSDTDTIYFQATNSAQNISISTWTKLEVGTVDFQSSHSDYDNATNYRFTPSGAGKYLCHAQCYCDPGSSSVNDKFAIRFYKNGSGILHEAMFYPPSSDTVFTLHLTALVDFNGSTDYLEVFGYNDGATEQFNSQVFGAMRLTMS